ncbi:MAG TPA: fatty acid desaturase [Polyangiaceae bacterium]
MASRRTDVPTLLLLGGMYAILGGNVALYHVYRLNPVVHVLISAVGVHLAFTVWHEAVHATASKSARMNNVVGVLGMLPYMTPYFMQRWVHLEHHRKLNLPDDPNFIYTDGPLLTLPFRYVRALGYAKKLLRTDPRTKGERLSDLVTTALVGSVYLGAVLTGHVVDVLVLWFVPVVVAKFVMDWYVNYLPHRGLPADKYLGTRIIDVAWFTPLVLGHNYHAVHHLWPTVPWHMYRRIYRKKLDHLTRHGVPIEHRVFGSWP